MIERTQEHKITTKNTNIYQKHFMKRNTTAHLTRKVDFQQKKIFFGLILWMCIPSFSGRATPDVIISKLKCSGAFVA